MLDKLNKAHEVVSAPIIPRVIILTISPYYMVNGTVSRVLQGYSISYNLIGLVFVTQSPSRIVYGGFRHC